MTEVYRSPNAQQGLRVVIAGAGAYPAAIANDAVPALSDLTSVAPSVMTFVERLLTTWRDRLSMDLLSVQLLLSDPGQSGGAEWPGFGVDGEAANGTAVQAATRDNIETALTEALNGASGDDGLLLFFCGHGFSKVSRFFLPSDFGQGGNPWIRAIDLDGLALALRQEPPRTQWLFWDCCADIPFEVLDALGPIGDSLLAPRASSIAAATTAYGPLSRFGVVSAPIGVQAFGVAGAPSRFTEMLVEGIDGAGAVRRDNGVWYVDDRGLVEALTTYAKRHPDLPDPAFYSFITPFTSDAPNRMKLATAAAPTSVLVAVSAPQRSGLKQAKIKIMREGAAVGEAPAYQRDQPGSTAQLCVKLPPRQTYTVTAIFDPKGAAREQVRIAFADLPLAEAVEFDWP